MRKWLAFLPVLAIALTTQDTARAAPTGTAQEAVFLIVGDLVSYPPGQRSFVATRPTLRLPSVVPPTPIVPPNPIHPGCRGASQAFAASATRSGVPSGSYSAFDRSTVMHLASMKRMG